MRKQIEFDFMLLKRKPIYLAAQGLIFVLTLLFSLTWGQVKPAYIGAYLMIVAALGFKVFNDVFNINVDRDGHVGPNFACICYYPIKRKDYINARLLYTIVYIILNLLVAFLGYVIAGMAYGTFLGAEYIAMIFMCVICSILVVSLIYMLMLFTRAGVTWVTTFMIAIFGGLVGGFIGATVDGDLDGIVTVSLWTIGIVTVLWILGAFISRWVAKKVSI